MPSVQDELEDLRRMSLAKSHKAKLNDANGLSTPEQEEQNIKTVKSSTRSSTYKKEAEQVLKAGSKAVDPFQMQQIALKKAEQQKQIEAKKRLQQFNSSQTLMDSSNRSVSERGDPPKVTNDTPNSEPKVETPKAAEKVQEQPNSTPSQPEETPQVVANAEPDLAEDVPQVTEMEEAEEVPHVPEIKDVPANYTDAAVNFPGKTPNRVEKKARKQMERLGMKTVPGIARVTLKRREGFFTIHNPDVFEKNGSYVVFGEARAGTGLVSQEQKAAQAAQQFSTVMEEKKEEQEPVPIVATDSDANVDETGVEAKDIDLVISQVGCSRAKAVTALKENGGDLVNAIMSLTS